jgi:hypothetical protein
MYNKSTTQNRHKTKRQNFTDVARNKTRAPTTGYNILHQGRKRTAQHRKYPVWKLKP